MCERQELPVQRMRIIGAVAMAEGIWVGPIPHDCFRFARAKRCPSGSGAGAFHLVLAERRCVSWLRRLKEARLGYGVPKQILAPDGSLSERIGKEGGKGGPGGWPRPEAVR